MSHHLPLIEFAEAVAAVPEAAAGLQELGGRYGAQPPCVVFSVWAAAAGFSALEEEDAGRLGDMTHPWAEHLTGPLTGIRRALAQPPEALRTPGLTALRERAAALAAEAERQLCLILQDWAEAHLRVGSEDLKATATANLSLYLSTLERPPLGLSLHPSARAVLAAVFRD